MNKIFIILIVAFSLRFAYADSKIIAVIGDDIVTRDELNLRYKFFLVENPQIEITNIEQERMLMKNILKSIVDEKLISQELEKHHIDASNEEINNTITQIESNREMGKGNFFKFVNEKGLTQKYAIEQIKKGILWDKFLSQVVAPQIEVSNDEMFEFIANNSPEDLIVDYIFAKGAVDDLSKLSVKMKNCQFLPQEKSLSIEKIKAPLSSIKDKNLRKAIISAAQDHPSYIFDYNNKKAVVFICEKKAVKGINYINNVHDQIKMQKVNLQADYYIKTLAKNKYIEILDLD